MSRPLHTSPALRRFARDTGGAALVEFAITFPFMVFLFGMIIEGTRLMWDYQSAITGVRDATRYIARVVPAEICASTGSGASLAAYMPTIANRVSPFPPRVTIDTVTPVLDCRPGTGVTYRNDPAPVVVLSATVTINFPFGELFSLVGSPLSEVTTVVTDESRIFGT